LEEGSLCNPRKTIKDPNEKVENKKYEFAVADSILKFANKVKPLFWSSKSFTNTILKANRIRTAGDVNNRNLKISFNILI
jgi:hypothetical protein